MKVSREYSAPALERGIEILQLFSHERTKISAPEIVRELQLNRSSTFRLLRTLERLHCVIRVDEGAYSVGPRALHLGSRLLASAAVEIPYLEPRP